MDNLRQIKRVTSNHYWLHSRTHRHWCNDVRVSGRYGIILLETSDISKTEQEWICHNFCANGKRKETFVGVFAIKSTKRQSSFWNKNNRKHDYGCMYMAHMALSMRLKMKNWLLNSPSEARSRRHRVFAKSKQAILSESVQGDIQVMLESSTTEFTDKVLAWIQI